MGISKVRGAIFRLEYNYPMKIEGPNIHFDKFATEDLWALSSLRALLFDEYRITQDINKLPKVVVSLLLQFDRHMVAAEAAGKITIAKHTSVTNSNKLKF